jgi:hypothetical protein
MLSSCSSENEEKSLNSKTLMRTVDDLEKFKKDVQVLELYDLMQSFKYLDPKSDTNEIYNVYKKIHTLREKIFDIYGEEDSIYYASELAKYQNSNPTPIQVEGDGNKCKRNSNGTTNRDECNFWESVVVGLVSHFQCHLTELPTISQIDSYYNCVQSVICDRC